MRMSLRLKIFILPHDKQNNDDDDVATFTQLLLLPSTAVWVFSFPKIKYLYRHPKHFESKCKINNLCKT